MLVAAGLLVGSLVLAGRRGLFGKAAGAVATAPPPFAPTTTREWFRVTCEAVSEFNDDRIPVVAAGITFFVLLALFPAMGAFVAVYGLFGDMSGAFRLLRELQGVLPDGAVSFLTDQITWIYKARQPSLGGAFFLGLAISIWSANSGVKALVGGLNVAYESQEKRNFLKLTLLSIGLTAGGLGIPLLLLIAASGLPEMFGLRLAVATPLVGLVKWPLTALVVCGALSVLYRYGPCRAKATWRWLTPGGLIASVAWLTMTLAYSAYVLHFGHFNRSYGPLGALIGFMIWMWLGLIVVLFGAELNAAIERKPG